MPLNVTHSDAEAHRFAHTLRLFPVPGHLAELWRWVAASEQLKDGRLGGGESFIAQPGQVHVSHQHDEQWGQDHHPHRNDWRQMGHNMKNNSAQ